MKMHSIKNSSIKSFSVDLVYSVIFAHRKQMYRLHFVAIGAGIGNSMLYFLHCASFAYGSRLVHNGEMRFDLVFR